MSLTRDPATSTAPPSPPGAPPAPHRAGFRPLLTRLHFYAGVFVAPFVLVAAVSGLLYAVSPQLEQVVHRAQLTTDSRGPALPLDEQVAAARSAQPDLPLLAVRPAPETGATTRVLFDDGRTAASKQLAVFVDPVDGDVQGSLTAYGSSGALPVRTWIDELHRGLHLGDPGRVYSEMAASWLWVIALAGLALWWTGPSRGGLAARLRPRRGGSPRRRTLSWHGAVGSWVVLGMLGLSATGLTWSQYAGANVTELRSALDWSTPAVTADLAGHEGHAATGHEGHGAGHGGHGGAANGGRGAEAGRAGAAETAQRGTGYQAAYDAGRGADLVGPLEVAGPTGPTAAFVVQELDKSWPTQADAAAVDPATDEVVDVVRFEDYPLAAKLARWGIDAHMGLLFGVWNQLALVMLAGALVTMIVLGYRMWWQRRPTRSHRLRMGRPARRGAWREVGAVRLAVVVVVTVGVGWFLPVLGLSLLVFVVLDGLVGLRRGRRERRPEGGVRVDELGDAA